MKMMPKIFTIWIVLIVSNSGVFAQTNISAGSVSGTWTKSGSPYKVNGDITVPDGQTLSIEPGVRIEFAQSRWMKVDGKVIAVGKSGSADSIWFTKQNPHDTGWWKGIKFIKPDSQNDTSRFSFCVFRNTKGIYDTLKSRLNGAIFIEKWGKVNINKCTFYNNESTFGSSIYISNYGYVNVRTSTFKYNSVSVSYVKVSSNSWITYGPRGMGLFIGIAGNAKVDSCKFIGNYIRKSYGRNDAIFDGDASLIEVAGSSLSGYPTSLKISNCLFDNNEGISIKTSYNSTVSIENCRFINGGKKSFSCIYTGPMSKVFSRGNIYQFNSSDVLIYIRGGDYRSYDETIKNNINYEEIIITGDFGITKGYSQFDRLRILNNTYDTSIVNNTGRINGTHFRNSLIANNRSSLLLEADMLTNNTVVNNYIRAYPIFLLENTAIWKNNIFRNNVCDSFPNRSLYLGNSVNAYLYNNNISNDTASFITSKYNNGRRPIVYQENFDEDPIFLNPTFGSGASYDAEYSDFSLYLGCDKISPCINSGSFDTSSVNSNGLDIGGNNRFHDSRIDVGAYENNSGPAIPVIDFDTKSDTMCLGQGNSVMEFRARGMGATVRWQMNASGNWSDMPGRNSDTLLIASPKISGNGVLYRAIVNGTCGSDTGMSAGVKVNPLPEMSLGNDTAVCMGDRLIIRPGNSGNYLWHDGSTKDSFGMVITEDTIWHVQINDSNGCMASDTVKIGGNQLPEVNLGADFSLHRLKSAVLDAGDHSGYLWNDGNTGRTRTFFGQDLGQDDDYLLWVKVNDSLGCYNSDSIIISVFWNSSIKSIFNKGWKLYPNPFNSIINITSSNDENFEWQLTDETGKVLSVGYGENQYSIDLSYLVDGLYFIKLYTKDGIESLKIEKRN